MGKTRNKILAPSVLWTLCLLVLALNFSYGQKFSFNSDKELGEASFDETLRKFLYADDAQKLKRYLKANPEKVDFATSNTNRKFYELKEEKKRIVFDASELFIEGRISEETVDVILQFNPKVNADFQGKSLVYFLLDFFANDELLKARRSLTLLDKIFIRRNLPLNDRFKSLPPPISYSLDNLFHISQNPARQSLDSTLFISFIMAGASPDSKSSSGKTALFYAAFSRNLPLFKKLIGLGADVNTPDKNGMDIFTLGVINEDLELLNLALNSGYEFNLDKINNIHIINALNDPKKPIYHFLAKISAGYLSNLKDVRTYTSVFAADLSFLCEEFDLSSSNLILSSNDYVEFKGLILSDNNILSNENQKYLNALRMKYLHQAPVSWGISREEGCRFMLPYTEHIFVGSWTGKCVDNWVQGHGKLFFQYDNGKAFSYSGSFENGKFHGIVETLINSPNGVITLEKTNYHHGVENGIFIREFIAVPDNQKYSYPFQKVVLLLINGKVSGSFMYGYDRNGCPVKLEKTTDRSIAITNENNPFDCLWKKAAQQVSKCVLSQAGSSILNNPVTQGALEEAINSWFENRDIQFDNITKNAFKNYIIRELEKSGHKGKAETFEKIDFLECLFK